MNNLLSRKFDQMCGVLVACLSPEGQKRCLVEITALLERRTATRSDKGVSGRKRRFGECRTDSCNRAKNGRILRHPEHLGII